MKTKWSILGQVQEVEVQDEKEMVIHPNVVNGKDFILWCLFLFFSSIEIVVDQEVVDPVVVIRIVVLDRVVHLVHEVVERPLLLIDKTKHLLQKVFDQQLIPFVFSKKIFHL